MTPLSSEQIRVLGYGIVGRYALGEGTIQALASSIKNATVTEKAAIQKFAEDELAGLIQKADPVAQKIQGLNQSLSGVSTQFTLMAVARSKSDARASRMQNDLNAKTAALTKTQADLVQAQNDLSSKDSALTQAKTDLSNKDAALTQTQNDLSNKNAALAQAQTDLQTTKDALTKALADLAACKQAKDAETTRANNEKARADSETTRANNEKTRADAEKKRADDNQAKLDAANAQIIVLGQQIVDLNVTVATLRKLLGPLAPK